MESHPETWPFLLLLPKDAERRHSFIRSILASKLAHPIMSSFDEDGKVIQRDLVENLAHSNKSILNYLNKLNDFGLTRKGSMVDGGKRVVYHELTKKGWGLSRFFFQELPSDIDELTSFLLEDYLFHIMSVFQEQGLSDSSLYDVFTKTRLKAILDSSTEFASPDCLIFGASAMFTEVLCDRIPKKGSTSRCQEFHRYPGGPTIELATALSRMGCASTFVSTVGDDQDGWDTVSFLAKKNVDVSNIYPEKNKTTNQTVKIQESSNSRTMINVDQTIALSIDSPSQVPWTKLERSKVVYVGEVFVEVAGAITSYSTSKGIPVVYRLSVPFLQQGIESIRPLLKHSDIVIIPYREWTFLEKEMGPESLEEILDMTSAAVILRKNRDTYEIYADGELCEAYEAKPTDLDIAPRFTAALLKGIIDGKSTFSAVENALASENLV